MTTKDRLTGAANDDAPKEMDSNSPATHLDRIDSPKAENLKVYEWANRWGFKPRQVVDAARRLNMRVQNRLTRLSTSDANRILTELQSPAGDSESD